MVSKSPTQHTRQRKSLVAGVLFLLAAILFAAGLCIANPRNGNPAPNIFDPHSTAAQSIHQVSFSASISSEPPK